MEKRRSLLITVIIFFVALIIAGSSYAFWSWNGNANKNIVFNTAGNLKNYIVYSEGESAFAGELNVSNSYDTGGIHSTISIYKTSAAADVNLLATIHTDINSIGTNMKNSTALKWTVTEGTTSNIGDVLAEGNFVDANDGDTLTLVTNIPVTTTETFYTIWIWVDINENPGDVLTGETLDTNVWTEINQVEGSENRYEITRKNANYQKVSATVIDDKYKIVSYAITNNNNTPSAWTSISQNNQSNVYTLNTTVNATGTYYIWFKDENNRIISDTISVTQLDTTGPTCSWGSFTNSTIHANGTSQITLTCTDNESDIITNRLTTSDITVSSNTVTVTEVTKNTTEHGYTYTITITGTANEGTANLTIPASKIKNTTNYGNASVTSGNVTVANTFVATIYYQSNATSGSQTVSNTTVQCSLTGNNDSCTANIPSAVTDSVGKYNNEYAGLADNYGTMNTVVPKSATTITLSSSGTYYATYSSPVTFYYPDSLSTCTSDNNYYRNQWFSSASVMSSTVISNSTTGTSDFDIASSVLATSVADYELKSINTTANNFNGLDLLSAQANSNKDTLYIVLQTDITGTYYYNSSTAGDGTYTIATATATAKRYLYCQNTTEAKTYNLSYTPPTAAVNSIGPYGETRYGEWKTGIATTTNNGTASVQKLFAIYSQAVTNYYYNSGSYTSRTVYRTSYFPNENNSIKEDEIATVITLGIGGSNPSNYSTERGPGSSTWYGLATTATTTRTYSSVSDAAYSNATTLYTIYRFGVNYSVGSNVASIGSSTGECFVTTSDTTCDVTLPSITPNTGYSSVGWNTSSGQTTGTAAGQSYTISTNPTTLYANAIDDIAPTGTLSLSGGTGSVTATISNTFDASGIASYEYLIQSTSTCPSSGYTSSAEANYTFNVVTGGTYYVCARIVDTLGNTSEPMVGEQLVCNPGYELSNNTCVARTYTINVNANGGTIPTTSGWTIDSGSTTAYKSVTYNTTYGTLPTPTRSGYTFAGWKNIYSYGNISMTAASDENYRFTEVYQKVKPGVTYHITMDSATKSSGSATKFATLIYDFTQEKTLASIQNDFGSSLSYDITAPADAVRTNNVVLLIYAGINGSTGGNSVTYTNVKVNSTSLSANTTITASTTNTTPNNHDLIATWTANTYTVNYDYNLFTNSNSSSNGVTITYDSANQYITLNGTTSGTTSDVNFGALTNMSFTSGEQYKVTLTYVSGSYSTASQWIVFVMDFQKNSEYYSPRTNGTHYMNISIPTSSNTTTNNTVTYTLSDANTLKFWLWHGDTGTATFNNYKIKVSATKVASKQVTYGNTYGTLTTPSKPGYTFSGWYTAVNGGSLVSASTTVSTASNHTVYARWGVTAPTLPTLNVWKPSTGTLLSSGDWSNENVSYNMIATSGNTSYMQYCTDTANTCTPNTTYTGELSASSNIYIRYRAVSSSSQYSSIGSFQVRIDKTIPTVSISPGGTNWYYCTTSYPITVSFSGSDTGGSGLNHIQVQIAQDPTCTGQGQMTIRTDLGGNFASSYSVSLGHCAWGVDVRAYDNAGNISNTPYVIDDNWTYRLFGIGPNIYGCYYG